MSIIEYIADNTIHIYNEMFNPGVIIDKIPPATKESIIITLKNLKTPDLFVKRVKTEENIIKIIARK